MRGSDVVAYRPESRYLSLLTRTYYAAILALCCVVLSGFFFFLLQGTIAACRGMGNDRGGFRRPGQSPDDTSSLPLCADDALCNWQRTRRAKAATIDPIHAHSFSKDAPMY
jgi:hypothetical protein